MKEINIDREHPLNRHHNIKILHDFNSLKSITLSNVSLDLHLSKSLISQLCLDKSGYKCLGAKSPKQAAFEKFLLDEMTSK